ncbi:urease accessory protein UreD [Arthrobacter sp. zg-Y820]|uniref:urease accessory protein UreD n=1 Tax=unclassified Arthrobacter TaxID=235627 RepID=UPI001E4CCA8E|nr:MULTISPECIES: urease accessory protein UreD [unclassified Arthrobacter]MCC9195470.1 urease accessory protein UreD [Arthrobacter sp. zg-Y820]MDK1278329.1 urease accessory protein UreD [Arthrobacter sp. zg.Y820]WIB10207.1 urease accessory protein UreD [Arthrobacter sp. zg-Y820]
MMRSRTLSSTATELRVEAARPTAPRSTRITTELSGGRARFSVLDQGLYLAPRPVHGTGNPLHLRVALIGIHMMLLGGDDVRIEVSVGSGVTLEVVEPAGLVAYDADLVPSRWSLHAEVGENAALIWDGASFVSAGGSNVHRETRLRLASGARALLRETLVLGRSGEPGGRLRSITRATGPDGDCLYEDLDLTGPRDRAVGILGSSKIVASTTAVGWRPAVLPPDSGTEPHRARRFELAAPGAVARSLSDQAHTADGEAGAVFSAWRDELTGF